MPVNNIKSNKTIAVGAGIVFSLALSACGGGSSGGGPQAIPIAPVAPTPVPPPPPPPTPTSANFNTAEYRRSSGPGFHSAATAYQSGASGQGVTVGVIDSGIDPTSHEFTGRISSQSYDATGAGRALGDEDGHGTFVSRVIAAAKDDRDVHGIAYNATILALRADTPGSCTVSGGDGNEAKCGFSDASIAAGLNRAVDAGARVVNISLGGKGGNTASLIAAVNRATRAGIVIVVSAGNEGKTATPKYDPLNPSPFAQDILAAGNGLVIISTSVDDKSVISDFSNRAGLSKDSVLSALGSQICCEYKADQIYRFEENGSNYVNVYNGTSFSAPQISGAAALLAQAFPNLTGKQIVTLLLTNARDAGDAGTDAIYGRGILDIARAFAPQGTTTLAGTKTAIPLSGAEGSTSAAMGDAAITSEGVDSIILDSYERAYNINLASGLTAAPQKQNLAPALLSTGRSINSNIGPAHLAFSIQAGTQGSAEIVPLNLSARQNAVSRLLAGRVSAAIAKNTRFSIGIRQSAANQIAELQNTHDTAFVSATSAYGEAGFSQQPLSSFAVRRELKGFGITASAETGKVQVRNSAIQIFRRGQYDQYRYNGAGIAIDRKIGQVNIALAASYLNEANTILGARFADSFGQAGSETIFVDGTIAADLDKNWSLTGQWRQGWTSANRTQTILPGSTIRSNAFTLDLIRNNAFINGDRIGLRLSQPLRVMGGGLALNVPLSYDYSSNSAVFGTRRYGLSPKGREIASEFLWIFPVKGGSVTTNIFWRQEPGHFERAPDDIGLALRLNVGF